jgi:hypothetical protein
MDAGAVRTSIAVVDLQVDRGRFASFFGGFDFVRAGRDGRILFHRQIDLRPRGS